jgi:phenylacetate-CoA ligase
VFLEIVDEQGKPCLPHQPGRVLITTLHNFATPLIRYELGDYAEFGDPCPCGRGLPVIKKILGRKRNRLIFPDGRSEFPYLGEHGQIESKMDVIVYQFQIVQHSVEEIEFKVVTSRPFTEEESLWVVSLVQENLGYPFHVTITLLDDIPKGPTGKFEEFVSKIP